MSAKKVSKKFKKRASNDALCYSHEIEDDERYDYLAIARQLCYPKEVQDAIKAAKSDTECERILKRARNTY